MSKVRGFVEFMKLHIADITKPVYFKKEKSSKKRNTIKDIGNICRNNGIEFEVNKVPYIWMRDFMPVKVDEKHILFKQPLQYHLYEEKYIVESLNDWVLENIDYEVTESDIYLDGGNVTMSDNYVCMTNRILEDNEDDLFFKNKVEDLFQRKMITLYYEKDDITGHVDGLGRFINNKFLMNDLSVCEPEAHKKNISILEKESIDFELIPYHPSEDKKYGYYSSKGNYINFINLGNIIIFPSNDNDFVIKEKFKQIFPEKQFYFVDNSEIEQYGGSLNCISWN